MDLNEIASKINNINDKFDSLENNTEEKLKNLETKISSTLEQNFEVKMIEYNQDTEKEDFINFLRTGEVKSQHLSKNLAQGSYGGGMQSSISSNNLISYYLSKFSLMRQICKFQEISSDSFDVVIEENGGKAVWGMPSNTEPFIKKFIKTHELVAEPKATSKLIEDSKIDIEKFMSEKIAESFALAEDDAFLNGDGEGNPRGILNGNSEVVLDSLSTKSLFELISKIDIFYSQNLSFLINKEVESKIKELKDENERHIWRGKILETENNTIFGIPVFVSNFMPSNKIVLGNFEKGYTIVEKSGNYVMRDPYTQRPFIKFYTAKKIGGDVVDENAFKVLSF